MSNTSDIKHRIKSVTDTYHITKAMELISVSKMKKAVTKCAYSKNYFDKVRYTIKDIILHSPNIEHKYIQHRKGIRTAYVVIAGDKGLAGGYNNSVLNMAWEHMQKRPERYVITIGQMAREFFENKRQEIDLEFTHAVNSPTLHDARGIMRDILNLYDQNLMDEVIVCYTRLISTVKQAPSMARLLPIQEKDLRAVEVNSSYTGDIAYHPSPKEVLRVLVPQYLVGTIYSTLVQSVASEHCARMVAMSSANKNAEKMLSALNLEYNKARQDEVTNELLEITSSKFAMEK